MPETTTVELVGGFFAVLAALALATVLLRPLWLPIWHLFRGTQQFLEDWFGEPADPKRGQPERRGAMARLAQLEKNSGTTMRDKIDALVLGMNTLGTQVAQVQETADQATTAAGLAVGEAKVAASVALEAEARRRLDVDGIRSAMGRMREEIAQDAAERTADAYELLAEHGGPDLRPHLPGAVPPHAHELPTVEQPAVTGGPIEPDDNDERGAGA